MGSESKTPTPFFTDPIFPDPHFYASSFPRGFPLPGPVVRFRDPRCNFVRRLPRKVASSPRYGLS